ncbi:hypothetical protein TNIN_467131 [Trichonephila inaurata madagascariensis]|uniref:Uncharacterized protein n=1 Tax=Trichonephila inaurata madagascariensis TaxID=2747483 RepID=A0A8X7BX29_9ARAC|nr:hypothetical protein TNIN_467131 [Trichonephila inaurata madagascariensis]
MEAMVEDIKPQPTATINSPDIMKDTNDTGDTRSDGEHKLRFVKNVPSGSSRSWTPIKKGVRTLTFEGSADIGFRSLEFIQASIWHNKVDNSSSSEYWFYMP